MKNRSGTSIMMLILVVLGALLISGCASLFGAKTGAERSTSTSEAMESVEVEIRNTAVKINAANTSLAALTNLNQIDHVKAYGVYSKDFTAVEAAAKNYLKLTDKMNAEGEDFFKEWRVEGNQYKDPKIRALSDQRRKDLRVLYDQIKKSSLGQEAILTQYISTNKEINTYLSTDSTPKGVAAIKPLSDKVIKDGSTMVQASDKILESIEKVRTELNAK